MTMTEAEATEIVLTRAQEYVAGMPDDELVDLGEVFDEVAGDLEMPLVVRQRIGPHVFASHLITCGAMREGVRLGLESLARGGAR